MAKKAKKKTVKKTAANSNPTLEQLKATAQDLNKFMNDINEGNYKTPIDLTKEETSYYAEEIVGMVKQEMYKQDKDSLNTDSVEIIGKLGVNFETLSDDPEMGGEENGRNGKEEEVIEEKAPEKPVKAAVGKKAGNPGVIKSIVDIIKEKGPISKQDVLDILVKRFPDRPVKGMGSTFNIQIGGRLSKEKGIKITKTGDKFSIEE